MSKRKPSRRAHDKPGNRRSDNPIIAAVQRNLPGGGGVTWDVDRPPDRVLTLMITNIFSDDVIREIGVLVIKSLLTGDKHQLIEIVEDAFKESKHLFRRDRELALRSDVAEYLPDLIASGRDIKSEIEKRSNCGNKLQQKQ
jgi:hypothetical protein